MIALETIELARFDEPLPAGAAERATCALESGKVLFFPQLAFALADGEARLLAPEWSDRKSKNIRYDTVAGQIGHTSAQGEDRARLTAMMMRFARQARELVLGVCPSYVSQLRDGLTSFRSLEVRGRAASRNKDDTRLHVDAFASRPTQGQRILRVFSNVNPDGHPRVWEVGEPFGSVAKQFGSRVPPQLPCSAWLLERLRITKRRRTPYDHIMLNLHDSLKRNDAYQLSAPKVRIEFPAGSTWIVYSDLVLHAALAGQHALEQTFFLPVEAMLDQQRSPLRTLEALHGRKLA